MDDMFQIWFLQNIVTRRTGLGDGTRCLGAEGVIGDQGSKAQHIVTLACDKHVLYLELSIVEKNVLASVVFGVK